MEPREKREKREERKGFSLIELVVVIGIIGILASIAFVSILHYRAVIRVNATARDMAGQMRLARAKGIKEGHSMQVLFQDSTNTYIIGPDTDENGSWDGFTRTYAMQQGIGYGIFDGIKNVPGFPWPVSCPIQVDNCSFTNVHFRADGTTDHSGAIYLIPEADITGTGNRFDRQRAVSWESTTGRVRVWKFLGGAQEWR